MVTIIFSHPWFGSFNTSILDTVINRLVAEDKEYQVIDLYKDNFNPAFSEEELALYSKGGTTYELTKRYQEQLKKSNEIIFIFPIWWSSIPAILKGFIDKVMLRGFAYYIDNTGWHPLLSFDKVTIISTSESPTGYFVKSIQDVFINQTLAQIGMGNATWYNLEHTTTGTDEHRDIFLNKVKDVISCRPA